MILNTGSRTDIPAYYSNWFYQRIEDGYVIVRNPYNPTQVTKYILSPGVIDAIVFCTKNPAPMLDRLDELKDFDMFWFVTITPYGKDIEPFVPDKDAVMDSFISLSRTVGPAKMSWRYDPIFIDEKYDVDFHINAFRKMSEKLKGSTNQVVVSFIDLYEKTKKNFPGVKSVSFSDQEMLIDAFSKIARENNMQIHLCCEREELVRDNVDASGCLSQGVLEDAIGTHLKVPKPQNARAECQCLLGADIGAYNTCGHGCKYCYANYDRETVVYNMKHHDPMSPLLVGELNEDDVVHEANQKSWKDGQMSIFDL